MRLSIDQWAMTLAVDTAKRSTCVRRSVGCIILNSRGHVMASGYNGVASGLPHCYEPGHSCKGALAPSGTNLDGCQAIHAEQNALLQCRDVYAIETIYVTASPCLTCTKLLLNTSCKRVVFLERYPHDEAERLWLLSGRAWEKLEIEKPAAKFP